MNLVNPETLGRRQGKLRALSEDGFAPLNKKK